MHKNPMAKTAMKREWLALLLLAGGALAQAAEPGPERLLRLSTAQQRLGGIALAPARAARADPSAQAGMALSLQGSAVLTPQSSAVISAPLGGYVQSIQVNTGQRLASGQTVAVLFSSQLLEMQRELVNAEVQLRQAGERLQRDEQMAAEGIVADSRVRDARHAQVQAKVAFEERQAALQLAGMSPAQLAQLSAHAKVRPALAVQSSAAGTVIEVTAAAGQRVEAGAPLLRLARPGPMTLELQATMAQSAQIKPGASIRVEGCRSPGRVLAMAPTVRESNQSVTVLALLPDGSACLRANQAVLAQVATGAAAATAVTVPSSALLRHEGKDFVFVSEGGGYRAVPVQVAAQDGKLATLSRGPAPGTPVVVAGVTALKGAWLGLGEQAATTDTTNAATNAKVK